MNNTTLRSPRARALVGYIERAQDFPYVCLDGVAPEDGFDVVDVTVEPELPQHRVVAIAAAEAIRLRFPLDDEQPPTVHARRADFPLDQVHTNYAPEADGVCLCIWEEKWFDLRRRLTPQALIERIRDWFTRTAKGVLHQEGQALEPLLPATAHTLIVPPGQPTDTWAIASAVQHNDRWTVSVEPPGASPKEFKLAVMTISVPPRVHGAIRHRPQTLDQLTALMQNLGSDLIGPLRIWLQDSARLRGASERYMLLIVFVPKLRVAGGEIESTEVWAFLPVATLSSLGEVLGCSLTHEGQTVAKLATGPVGVLNEIKVDQMRVVQRLDRAAARRYSGIAVLEDRRFVAVGAGALGSNVVIGTVRSGLGTWTIIDDDIVLPHNTVRQHQDNRAVGCSKAHALEFDSNVLLAESGAAEHIWANVLKAGKEADRVRDRMKRADLVVDFSASPAVLGYISDLQEVRRASSIFFNPDGSDLVVLSEDSSRHLRLDEIEAQYFLALAEPNLAGHLSGARADFIRYANACQDLSRPLEPWRVRMLAGLAGGQLIGLSNSPAAAAGVWRLDARCGAIVPVTISLAKVSRHALGDWRITYSYDALESMRKLRHEAAPNETGGVLIGSFDLSRRVAHVLAARPAPPDSRQTPTHFVRGKKCLKPVVDELASISAGVLGYLGEWHSHPDRASARPSGDDEAVYRHLESHIGPTGAPYMISICGDHETWFRVGVDVRTLGEAAFDHDAR